MVSVVYHIKSVVALQHISELVKEFTFDCMVLCVETFSLSSEPSVCKSHESRSIIDAYRTEEVCLRRESHWSPRVKKHFVTSE